MNIKPYIGFDNTQFGQTRDKVKELLGSPDNIESVDNRDDTISTSWFYRSLNVKLNFDSEDDYRLCSITVFSNSLSINGNEIIGIKEADLIKYFPEIMLEDDFEENGKDFWLESYGISFWIIDGYVNSFTIFTKFDESGQNIIWPTNVS